MTGAATPAGEAMREAVAREIDPGAWRWRDYLVGCATHQKVVSEYQQSFVLAYDAGCRTGDDFDRYCRGMWPGHKFIAVYAARLDTSLVLATAILAGPIASELARLTAERDAYRRRGDNHAETLRGVRKWIREGDLERALLWISDGLYGYTEPAERTLAEQIGLREAAEAALTSLRAEHAAEVARLKGALKLAENPLSYRHATDPSGPGSVAVARALDAVRAALATTETTDA